MSENGTKDFFSIIRSVLPTGVTVLISSVLGLTIASELINQDVAHMKTEVARKVSTERHEALEAIVINMREDVQEMKRNRYTDKDAQKDQQLILEKLASLQTEVRHLRTEIQNR